MKVTLSGIITLLLEKQIILWSMLTNTSKHGQLSRHDTNHSIGATCNIIMDERGFESRHILKVSDHKSEA